MERHMTLRAALLLSAIWALPQAALAGPPKHATEHASEHATSIKPEALIRLNQLRSSALLFKTDTPGQYINAPSVNADVDIDIAGPIIRTTLSQTFQNNSDDWVEGIYVFPLPENAAVDRLRMVIGGRFIEGQIKERKKAKKIYDAAKREGRRASLVEQERPNMFTASVANIGPRESISIQIEYQDIAQIKNGEASFVFPMNAAPRYSPPAQILQIANADDTANHSNPPLYASFDPVLDRARITPPLMPPSKEPISYMRLPVSIDISLDAGFKLADIKSPYHEINITQPEDNTSRASISLTEGAVPANRDFKLVWNAAANEAPQKAIFKETIGEETYLMTMFTPPVLTRTDTAPNTTPVHKRESIFVIDTSGSMSGASIEQARKALKLGLSRLGPDDRFNVIAFNTSHFTLFSGAKTASPEAIDEALIWIGNLKAGGGTNMQPAMQSALKGTAPKGWLRQVIFITDGAIGNETQLFATIQDELKSARLFPVGIGSAPNRFFMSRAAKFGRGTSVAIGDIGEVNTQMRELFTALENPLLTNLQISLQDELAETYPTRLPDLYSGEPVISVARMNSIAVPETITVSGQTPRRDWQDSLKLEDAIASKGVSVIWARRKIAGLEELRYDRQRAPEIDAAILKTALAHNLVSRLTSLVAVDITPARDISIGLSTKAVPAQLPKGWGFAALNRGPDISISRAPRSAYSPQSTIPSNKHIAMPATASPHIFLWLIGLIMLGLSKLLGGRAFGRNHISSKALERNPC